MKSNTVKIIFTDSNGLIIDQLNSIDDHELFFELLNGRANYYLSRPVTDAIEVATEEMADEIIAEDEKRNEHTI